MDQDKGKNCFHSRSMHYKVYARIIINNNFFIIQLIGRLIGRLANWLATSYCGYRITVDMHYIHSNNNMQYS